MDKTYIQILTVTLNKKNDLLEQLIQLTSLQEENISEAQPNVNQFEELIAKKDGLINQLNQLDDGFEKIYNHIREELLEYKNQYKSEIVIIQELIKQVTEKSMKLLTMEKQNKSKMDLFFLNKKSEIKNFKVSNQSVSNYYKNMANQHQGQSYFLDKKN